MRSAPEEKVRFFADLLRCRTDVYAVRWKNRREGRSGWMLAIDDRWVKGMSRSDALLSAAGPRQTPSTGAANTKCRRAQRISMSCFSTESTGPVDARPDGVCVGPGGGHDQRMAIGFFSCGQCLPYR